ncbi:MAG: hypothetical protein ACEPOV_13600 [Hyphomicrobiales bacterium]
MIKYILTTALSFILLCSYSQSLEEMIKKREEAQKAMLKKQQKGIQKMEEDFNKYVEERDKDFANFLKQNWEEFDKFTGTTLPKIPEPVIPPSYDEKQEKDRRKDIQNINPVKAKTIIGQGSQQNKLANYKPPLNDYKKEENTEHDYFSNFIDVEFNYFGELITIKTDQSLIQKVKVPLKPKSFSKLWLKLANSNYANSLRQIKQHSDRLQLNDWAFYMLIDAYSKTIHQNDDNNREALCWFLMIKSGYKVKLAYSNLEIAILLPTNRQLFECSYFTINDTYYYLSHELSSSKARTYKKDYEGSNRILDMSLYREVKLPVELGARELSFNYNDQQHSLSFNFNRNLIDFFSSYPILDLGFYLNTAISSTTAESIKKQLKPFIQGMDEMEMSQFLLTFIHDAMPYKTDEEQFGREKYFFPEEVFIYPYSDCEDRSALYSYLIKDLVGLETIGIQSPQHLFTAVKFNQPIGDKIIFEEKVYSVCDPTYIGAKIGDGMPDAMNSELIIYPIHNMFMKAKSDFR